VRRFSDVALPMCSGSANNARSHRVCRLSGPPFDHMRRRTTTTMTATMIAMTRISPIPTVIRSSAHAKQSTPLPH
jgi:hypothetical protein